MGYIGKLLRVDLSNDKRWIEDTNKDWIGKFVGGSGLGAKYLFELGIELPSPLNPENPIIFMAGPFAGTRVPMSGRHSVVTRSPLTGIFGESDVGGSWGSKLKKAGLDGIIITGKSEFPVYLWIHNGRCEIRDASHIWGEDTYKSHSILRSETHGKAEASIIGPAGENKVAIASIMSDGNHARAAGRCGTGAVMGSKNLKAVVVYGDADVPVFSPERVSELPKRYGSQIVKNTEAFRKYGTAGGLVVFEAMGTLPIKNWKFSGRWEESAEKISGITMAESVLTGRFYCDQCMVGCGRTIKFKQSAFPEDDVAGPEYETLAMLGSNCLIDDLQSLCLANELCNRLGLDTISTGGVIAFIFEAFEKGIIDRKDCNGLDLKWGNVGALLDLIKLIAYKKGIGKLLGEGVKVASEKLGKNSIEFAMHTKGLELPAHDPRGYNAGATAFATSARGACHLSGFSHTFERALKCPEIGIDEPMDRFDVVGKGILAAKTQNLMGMMDSLKLCKFILFGGITLTDIVAWYRDVTGVGMDVAEFIKTGERIFNLKRLYNVNFGISRKDDTLPFRSLSFERVGEGLTPNLPPLGTLLSEYYDFRGWSEDGIPTRHKIEDLGLSQEWHRIATLSPWIAGPS
jgi:aldehyde:ferredoxin oxidoreductase